MNTIFSKFLFPESVIAKARLSSQKRSFESVSFLLSEACDQALSIDAIYQKMFERERLSTTSIGQGIVMPHCKISGITFTQCALITLKEAIAYEAIDDMPVDIFCALILPPKISSLHHTLILDMQTQLLNTEFQKKLRQVDTNECLYSTLTD